MPDLRGSDEGGSGTPVIPPRFAMTAVAAGFSAAAVLSMLLGACDIGGILAAIAFVFGLLAGFEGVVARMGAGPGSDEGGSGSPVIPPKPSPILPPPPLLETGAAGSLLAALFALLVERCPLATALAVIALVLLLLALLLRPRGRGAGSMAARS